MLKVSFKDVGQGDSVILEWEGYGKNLLGVIDCKRHEGKNPVLDYLKEIKCTDIFFLIMSHPHYDHCSGFVELIDYCLTNDIKIHHFLLTSQITRSYILAAAEPKSAARAYLDKLSNLLIQSNDEYKFEVSPIQGAGPNPTIELNEEMNLTVLAPTARQLSAYIRDSPEKINEEEGGNRPNANWLSSIIKISCKDW